VWGLQARRAAVLCRPRADRVSVRCHQLQLDGVVL
jgi:hypothetical protein